MNLHSLENQYDNIQDKLIDLYAHFHQNPELSFMEMNTSAKLINELRCLGFEIIDNLGGYSFVGILSNGEGPTLAFRTDMDALPILENTDSAFKSIKKMKDVNGNEQPVMHACGHDLHMSTWVGIAKLMSNNQGNWKGTLVMIAQASEEWGAGARSMIEAGLFKKIPTPSYILAYHNAPNMAAGEIGYKAGAFMSGVKTLELKIKGIGGHGAEPQNTIDPIVMASKLILDFQTIISREIPPTESCVLSIGSIHGGFTHNVIPDEVNLQMTLRFFKSEIADKVIESIKRISNGIAISSGLEASNYPELKIIDTACLPPVENNHEYTLQSVAYLKEIAGVQNVNESEPVMIAEDFSLYSKTTDNIPTTMFWIGNADRDKLKSAHSKGKTLPVLHSPMMYPDYKNCIRHGTVYMSELLIKWFNNLNK
ncbi:M20 metallopeptidase family protein [Aureibacter tunicatorum]|uniref:Hippurate hydrolase n=1 Tax=Aureibacter tunicatorum TaxID=866807 RepID=A0AAE4BV94_9BACT|nr:amidohydrolase [Aureibacter tunicatorum]MDR6241855.1 hippurate hydrolase [Aureibacter tunicatorum]BDD07102.1 putative amidohydrolase [Aureibacter tunicatorum]